MKEIISLCIKETIAILEKDSPTHSDICRAITLLNSACNIKNADDLNNG